MSGAAEVDALMDAVRDERAARKVAGDSADRFRDVLSEVLGHHDSNPGDDVLVSELRAHFGRTGPEPTRWRDFVGGAVAHLERNGFRWQSDVALDADPGATS